MSTPITHQPRLADLSRFQGDITWDQVPDWLVGSWLAVTDWRTGNEDPKVRANIAGSIMRGVLPGGYQRVNPVRNTPEREALLFLGRLHSLSLVGPGRLLPMIDIEPTSTTTDLEFQAGVNMVYWVTSFFQTWSRVAKTPILWYSSGSFFNNKYGGLAGLPFGIPTGLVVAHWARNSDGSLATDPAVQEKWAGASPYTDPDNPLYPGARATGVLAHQYTSRGQVSGVTGNVDLHAIVEGGSLSSLVQGEGVL